MTTFDSTPKTNVNTRAYSRTEEFVGDIRNTVTARLLYSEVGPNPRGTTMEIRHFFQPVDGGPRIRVNDSLSNDMARDIAFQQARHLGWDGEVPNADTDLSDDGWPLLSTEAGTIRVLEEQWVGENINRYFWRIQPQRKADPGEANNVLRSVFGLTSTGGDTPPVESKPSTEPEASTSDEEDEAPDEF